MKSDSTRTSQAGSRLTLVLVGLLLIASTASAQTASLYKSPTKVIQKYLDLDLKGARLNALTFEAQRPYVGWTEEPVWGQVVVVADYEIVDRVDGWKVINNVDVIIPVTFRILGSVYLEHATFVHDPHVERHEFHVKAINGMWHIVDPMLPPHVGQKRTLNYIRQAMLEEEDPERRGTLTTLRDEVLRAKSADESRPQAADSSADRDRTFSR